MRCSRCESERRQCHDCRRESNRLAARRSRGGELRPAQPFTEWVRAYTALRLRQGLTHREIADELRVSDRQLRRYRKGISKAQIDVVDRALTNAAATVEVQGVTIFSLDDLYPLES